MDSIYSGGGTFWWTGLIAVFILPLVTLFKPVLPIALSLTLVLTAYICIMVGMEELKNSAERGVAGIVAVTLAMPTPQSTIYAIVIGVALYFLIERQNSLSNKSVLSTKIARFLFLFSRLQTTYQYKNYQKSSLINHQR